MFSRRGWELGTADERPQLRRRPPDPAGICRQATAEIPCVPQQAVGSVPFEVIPYLLRGIELRRVARELFQVQPGVGLAYRLDGQPPMHRAAVPEHEDVPPKMRQECSEEVGHME